jgi:hypothetical protein
LRNSAHGQHSHQAGAPTKPSPSSSQQLRSVELQRISPSIANTDKEKLAAQRSIALIDAGKWKHQHTDIYIPASWVRQILERFASGEVSLLEDEFTEAKSKKRSSRQRRRVDRGR